MIVVRSEYEMAEDLRDKIALFCDIDTESVIEARDEETIYNIVIRLQEQHMDSLVIDRLGLRSTEEAELEDWKHLLDNLSRINRTIKIALDRKSTRLNSSHVSISY